MLVVADTSALVALAACEGLGLLDALFDDVRVPPAVWRECSVEGKPFAARLAEYLQERVVDVRLAEDPPGASGWGGANSKRWPFIDHSVPTACSSMMSGPAEPRGATA